MKRILMVVAMAAVAFPGSAAPFGHGQHNPGHGNGGGYTQPSQPGHGNHPGQPPMPGHGGGMGQPSYPGHGPQPGQPPKPGHGGGMGHPSYPGHGPQPGQPPMPGHGGGMGHPSYPGHGPQPGHGNGGYDHAQRQLRENVRRIQGLFRLAENAFFPGMTRRDMMECARTLSQIERDISEIQFRLPGMASHDAGRVIRQVGQARFALMTEFNAREAHQIVRRASMDFDMIADRLMMR